MKKDTTLALLEDIAKLLKKHGPETFHALGKLLDSPDFVRILVTVLQRVAKIGKEERVGKPRQATPRVDISPAAQVMVADDPEKYATLQSLREALMDADVVRNVRGIRDLAAQFQISLKSARTRREIVDSLVDGLADHPIDELGRLASQLHAEREGSGLSGWSRIILPRAGKNTQIAPQQEDGEGR